MDSLHVIGEEMNKQDNRATSFPIFVIQERKKEICHDDLSEGQMAIGEEGDELDEEELCEECKLKFDCSDSNDESCVTCGYCKVLPYREVESFNLRPGVFLTAKACNEHLAVNHYHYDKSARSYAVSAWRNPELMTVMTYLSSLSNAGVPKDYYKL